MHVQPAKQPHSHDVHPDIVVAGAGVVGLALALALAKAGFDVLLLGPAATARNGRTVALLEGSVNLLANLGVWPAVRGLAAPLTVMRIVDDTPSLFRGPPIDFRAAEIGLAAFGYNVENADLMVALANEVSRQPGLTRSEDLLAEFEARPEHIVVRAGDRAIEPKLLIAADGGRSMARQSAGIGARENLYPQTALTAILDHDAPHRTISTEFHTRQGPFTLVPLPGLGAAANRSSLVWVMTPEEAVRRIALGHEALNAEIEAQSQSLLGAVRVQGEIGQFPLRRMVAERLVAPRLALAGEAAHALPPIGAQGLNVSLRDVATLVDELVAARAAGLDPGSARVLARYERARLGDVALRAAGVDALNKALLSSWLPVDALRGAGLAFLAAVPWARQAIMRQGLRPQNAIPRLMR